MKRLKKEEYVRSGPKLCQSCSNTSTAHKCERLQEIKGFKISLRKGRCSREPGKHACRTELSDASTDEQHRVSTVPQLHLAVQTTLSWCGSDQIDELLCMPVLYVEEA